MQALSVTEHTSPLSRLDVRVKLSITIIGAISVLSFSTLLPHLMLFSASLLYALSAKKPRELFFLWGVMALFMGFAWLVSLGLTLVMPSLSGSAVKQLIVPFLRALTMMNLVMGLALSTRIEALMDTLERLHLPFVIFLPAIVMVRFIPAFTQDIRALWEALKIRGWPLNAKMMTLHPLLCMRLLTIPLLFRTLKSSETLGIASELKGVGAYKTRTQMPAKSWETLDWCFVIVAILLLSMAILANFYFPHFGMDPNAFEGLK